MANLKILKNVVNTLAILSLVTLTLSGPQMDATASGASIQQQTNGENELVVQQPALSADGLILRNAVPIQIISGAPMRPPAGAVVTPEPVFATSTPIKVGSAFSITFLPGGARDYWGNTCLEYPKDAQKTFLTAATILASTFNITVPVTVKACWITGPDSSTFGYWGGVSMLRDFTGAQRANTWYPSSLANNLHGSDLLPGETDFHVSFNSQIAWTIGVENESTLLLSSYHQLVHALGFFCSADYSAGGLGSYGYGTGFPSIFDIYLENKAGVVMTDYDNPSLALGKLLTGENLYFGGINAVFYNNLRGHVGMDASNNWADNRNGSHFKVGAVLETTDAVMNFVIVEDIDPYGSLPGLVTRGVLYDLGWLPSGSYVPFPITPNGVITTTVPVFLLSRCPS